MKFIIAVLIAFVIAILSIPVVIVRLVWNKSNNVYGLIDTWVEESLDEKDK